MSFFTGDGVTLTATYYPSRLGKDGGCVLLLHDPDPKEGPAAEDWGRLAKLLQARGHAVLRLDFRGHGGSTRVSPQFWARPENRRFAPPFGGGLTARQTLPALVNDVAVARLFLDWANDNGELNSANLVVVGAGGGATVGMLWLASECARRAATSPPPSGSTWRRPSPAGRTTPSASGCRRSASTGCR